MARPAIIMATANGGTGNHASLLGSFQMPDATFASAGHRDVAKQVYKMAGVGPSDIDVALLSDHFSPMVLMQIEDYGFCPIGEGGPVRDEARGRRDDVLGVGILPTDRGVCSDGRAITRERLRDIFVGLADDGALRVKLGISRVGLGESRFNRLGERVARRGGGERNANCGWYRERPSDPSP